MSFHGMSSLTQDISFSFRLFRRRPVEAALAVAALALGVGLSTAMFSILWGTVLRGLPFKDADRLVRVETISQGERVTPTDAEFLAWRSRQHPFEGMAAWLGSSFNLSGAGLEAARCNGAYVSANLFRLAQVRPLLGRDFTDDDETPNAPLVAILSAELWKKQFSGDANVLGKLIKLNSLPAQVIGVMPEGLGVPLRQELWVPLQLDPQSSPQGRAFRVQVLGKLKEQISPRQAEAALQITTASHRQEGAGHGARVTPFVKAYTEDLQPVLYLLFGASIGLLLVVCANVSGLLTAQTVARLPELAVRSAVGATRARLLFQMMAETAVLALLGAFLSLPLALAAIRTYLASQGGELPSFWMDVRLEAPAIAYSMAIAILVSFLSTGIPSLQATGRQLYAVLNRGTGSTAANPLGALSGLRLVLQLGLSFALLVATGLFLASLRQMGRLDFGYAPDRILTAQLLLPSTYSAAAERLRFFTELKGHLEPNLGPGQVAFASSLPGNAVDETEVEIEGQPIPSGVHAAMVPYLIVSREYSQLLHVSALQGRFFDTSDRADGPPVAVVNQSFVRRYFGARPPVGARFRSLSSYGPGPWRTIVGVVPNLVLGEASSRSPEGFYVPLEQAPPAWVAVLLRTSGNPTSASKALRLSVAAVDREIPVFWIKTLQTRIDDMRLPLKTMGQVFLTFGLAALFLSLLGVYGVTARTVASRSREMAIRLTLGGQKTALLRVVLSRAFLQVIAGIAVGVLISLGTSHLLASRLFGVQAWEPSVFGIVGCAFILAGLLACLFPVARVLRLQPGEVLRGE